MFKRFQVLDLFYPTDKINVKNWVSVTDELPSKNGIYKVRLNNKNEVFSYFCLDRCSGLTKYVGLKSCYWWDKSSKEPLYDVEEWGKE